MAPMQGCCWRKPLEHWAALGNGVHPFGGPWNPGSAQLMATECAAGSQARRGAAVSRMRVLGNE